MTANLRRYPDYKDSGLPWLGTIPVHWDIRRNGRLFAQRNETGFGDLPILEVSLKTGVRVRDMENLKRKQVMSDREKYKRAVKGDVAYNMMRMWQGAIGAAPVDGLVSPAYLVARPLPGTDTRYFSYLFRTGAYMAEVDGYSRGIVKDRNRLYWEDFKRMPSCYPPAGEQTVIADYLDANAALVRKFIRNRRRLIDVLNEQQQAIISHAVTHGLDANVPLKLSGVDWLGDVPAGWTLKRLKVVVQIRSGQVDPKLNPYRQCVLVAPEHIEKGTGVLLRQVTAEEQNAISGKYVADAGQVIYSKIRPALRKAVIAPCDCLCSADMYPLMPSQELMPEFLLRLLLSPQATRYLVDCSMRVAMPKVNREALGALWLCYPDKGTQAKILNALAVELAPLNAAVQRTLREIDLIREYRTRLIADVVMGRLDVRHLAPQPGTLEAEDLPDIDVEGLDEVLAEDDEPDPVEELADADE